MPTSVRRRSSALAAVLAVALFAPVLARVLVMLALTRTSVPTEIQRMFTEY